MADWLSREQRSRNMASIRSKGNATTEGIFLQLLRKANITGWRRHVNLPGKPDFVFRSQKVVVFVDGCFWHGCPRCYRVPKDNRSYWKAKVVANRLRDKKTARLLRATGWTVLRVWEHSLANQIGRNLVLAKVERAIDQEPVEIANEIFTKLGIEIS